MLKFYKKYCTAGLRVSSLAVLTSQYPNFGNIQSYLSVHYFLSFSPLQAATIERSSTILQGAEYKVFI